MADPLKDFLQRTVPSPGSEKVKPKPKPSELVPLLTRHPKAVRSLLKIVSAEQNKSVQELIAEGINMVFVKYGKDAIA